MKQNNPHFISFEEFVKRFSESKNSLEHLSVSYGHQLAVSGDRVSGNTKMLLWVDETESMTQDWSYRAIKQTMSPITQENTHSSKYRSIKLNNKETQIPVPKGKSGAASARRQAKKRRGRK